MVDVESDFVAVAVAHGLIQENHADTIRQHAATNNLPPSDAALTLSMLQANEVEAVNLLCSPDDLAPGYQLTGLIGCGAGGIVFRARQTALNREVALKTINPQSHAGKTTGQPRIQREAHAIAKLRHPGIVAAFDSGFYRGRFCIAMELVEGENLVDFIQRKPHLSENVVWQIARQVACALSHACDAGIIHRDIKPANLLLCKSPKGIELPIGTPFVKVADFGLATDDDASNQITVTGATLGTPAYVAPEQLQNPKVDSRADIYSLGATVFHMICGHPPCIGQSPMKTIMQKSIGDSRWREELSSEASLETRSLLFDMTESDPEQRIPDYETLIQRIDDLLAGIESKRRSENLTFAGLNSTIHAEQALDDSDATQQTISLNPLHHPASRNRSLWKIVPIFLSALLVLATLMYLQGQDNSPAEDLAKVEVAIPEFIPSGFPQPLFNGTSVPLQFRQSGVWIPTQSSDESYVLAGDEGCWMRIPLSVNEFSDYGTRLRVGVNLTNGSEAALEIVDPGSKSSTLATVHLAGGLAKFAVGNEEVSESVALPDATQDTALFQRLAFIRHGTTVHAILNGDSIGKVQCGPESAVTLRCVHGTTNFADIDIVSLKSQPPS